jgi:hypothetical protein
MTKKTESPAPDLALLTALEAIAATLLRIEAHLLKQHVPAISTKTPATTGAPHQRVAIIKNNATGQTRTQPVTLGQAVIPHGSDEVVTGIG